MSMVSTVVAIALLAVLGTTSAAGEGPHASPRIACPLLGSPPICCGPVVEAPPGVVPCCPVPTVGCCLPIGGPVCCPTTPCPAALSIAATPDPASDGHEATISGALTGGAVGAQTVVLYERLAGGAAFSDVAQTQTDSAGGYHFARAVHVNAEWYAQSGSDKSVTVDEAVLAAVALRASRVRPAAGAKDKLSGTIAPSHAGERVALQRLRTGHWVTVARPRLGAASHFAVTTERMRGIERFRVVLGADARNARSVSGVVVIYAR